LKDLFVQRAVFGRERQNCRDPRPQH
jgi:hypothetical protein